MTPAETEMLNPGTTVSVAVEIVVSTEITRACVRAEWACNAEAAWALTAESSVEVTLPAPPPAAEILLLSASKMDCNPLTDTAAVLRADAPLTTDARWLTVETRLTYCAEDGTALPPAATEIRFERASMILCIPRVETAPTDRAEMLLTRTDTRWLRMLTARLSVARFALTMIAVLLVAFATDSALEAALDSTETA